MIAHIQGKLVEKTPTEVVIECNGVGYEIHISLHTYSQIPESENVKLYTFLQVKEDSHSLFGFADKKESIVLAVFAPIPETEISNLNNSLSFLSANPNKECESSFTCKKVYNLTFSDSGI